MKKENIIVVAVITLFTALAWVFFDAYHAYTVSTVAPSLVQAAVPITPRLDKATIEELGNRQEPADVK